MTTLTKPPSELILESARAELTKSGILGLRVAEVARGAGCSITSIYRYYVDRNGLLAQVLGDIMEEIVDNIVNEFLTTIRQHKSMTIDDLADAIPLKFAYQGNTHKFRLQILAAAAENPTLDERLTEVFNRRHDLWKSAVAEARTRMAPGEDFDDRVFFGFLSDLTPWASSYLGPRRLSLEELKQLIADKLRANARPRD